jgi:Fe-S cluster assembly protein SufD
VSTTTTRPHSHGGVPAADRGERLRGTDPASFPVPTGREEDWRFTPLARLRGLHDGTVQEVGKAEVAVAAPAGAVLETVGREDVRLGSVGTPADRVAAEAYSRFEEATVVTVPPDTTLVEPVVVSVRGLDPSATAFGHLLVDVGRQAEAVVVLDHTGSTTYADNVEVRVADGGRLTLVTVQDWNHDAVHASAHHLLVGRDARVVHVAVTLGADLVRLTPEARFAGPGGSVEMLGLFFTDPGQHHEHRLFVDHDQPQCRSRVNYKGALQGAGAHSVWIGDVLIRALATGTDTYEVNRNLLLTDGARADSVPNLEIETGEVAGAGHASVTGRLDDDQLFYLMARGISKVEARRLVVRGFFSDLRDQIGVPVVSSRLDDALERELAQGAPS